jgi:hypothetical protein
MVNRRRLTALLAIALAMLLALSPAAAQTDDDAAVAVTEDVTPAVAQLAPVELSRSDTFTSGVWELAVGETFVAPSPTTDGVTEFRMAITMRNVGDATVAYRPDGFFSDPGYPRLGLVDSSGTMRPLRPARSLDALLPGSTLHSVPPGMTGRWTTGFDVPTRFADDVRLLVAGVDGVAAFDLATGTGSNLSGGPEGAEALGVGDSFEWSPGLTASAVNHGAMVCGDPERQLIAHIVAVSFEVTNATTGELEWPGVDFPADLAIVQWRDGTTARHSSDTYVGDFDTDFDRALPTQTFQRALLFAAPRDARVGAIGDHPIGLWLQTPDADPTWLSLDGAGDLRLDPTLCDEDLFGFTIPWAFAPGPDFTIGNFEPEPDPAQQDLVARQLLSEAVVVAGQYREANDGSYVGMTAAALRAIWDGITYNDGFVPDVGEVGVKASIEATDAGDIVRGVLVTESATGTFFCAADGPEGVSFGIGATLLEAEAVCDPASAAARAAAEAAALAADAGATEEDTSG